MNNNQLAMIHRIIRNSSHPELSVVLREAMARNRKEVIQEVNNQSTPLFEHLIPLVALKQKKLPYPTNWPGEINSCLLRIHAKNGSKSSKKRWLEAGDIERILNEHLIPNLQSSIMRKLEQEKGKSKPFPEKTQSIVKEYLSKLFSSEATLAGMGISLKYKDDPLTLFINKERI